MSGHRDTIIAFIVSNPVGGVDEYEKELSVALRIVAFRSEGKGSHLKIRGIARVIGSLVDADGLTAVAPAANTSPRRHSTRTIISGRNRPGRSNFPARIAWRGRELQTDNIVAVAGARRVRDVL